MAKLNIQPMGMFHTPESQEELLDMIERHCPEERAVMMMAMAWTWNYLAGVVRESQGFNEDHQNPYANIGDPDGHD